MDCLLRYESKLHSTWQVSVLLQFSMVIIIISIKRKEDQEEEEEVCFATYFEENIKIFM